MTTLDASPEIMGDVAEDAVHQYDERHEESLPATMSELENILSTGPTVDRDEVRSYLEEVGAFYADELDVDAGYVDEIWDKVRYNPSPEELLRDTASPFGGGVTAAGAGLFAGAFTALHHAPDIPFLLTSVPFENAPGELAAFSLAGGAATALTVNYMFSDGRYDPLQNRIGVGRTEREGPRTFWTVAAETYHAYQYDHESPTKDDPLLTEGSERAASTKALEWKASQEDDAYWEQAADAFRGFVLTRGYAQHHAFAGEDPADALQDIGLDREDAERMTSDLNSGDAEYNFAASTLLALDTTTDDAVLADVFHGDADDHLDPYRDQITPSHRAKYGMKKLWKTILPGQ